MSPVLFDSVGQMLSPYGLSRLLGGAAEVVARGPLEVEHYSGNTLERLDVVHNGRLATFVFKHFRFEHDWIMRLTHDHGVREVTLFRAGVYERLPDQCYVPIIAAARRGRMWTSLMVDVSPGLMPSGATPIPLPELTRVLAHLAAMHAHHMHDDSLRVPGLGLSTLHDFVSILAPATAALEVAHGRVHPVITAAVEGWTVFNDVAPREAARVLAGLHRDTQPLLNALARTPHTLVHGDYKFANLGALAPPTTGADHATAEEPRTIMLDWQDATFGPPLLDLGYFLAIEAARLPVPKDVVLEMYREELAAAGYRTESRTWERDVALGLLAGGAMRLLWQKALRTQATDPAIREQAQVDLAWWSEQVVRARGWLS